MEQAGEPEGKFVEAAGLRLHYRELGSGDPLVMLHGGGPGASGWSNFRRNVGAFAERYRVLVLDLPGYGQSEKPRVESGIYAFLADALRGFMDAVGLEKADLIGNSLGGGTAMKLAMDHPERVGRLVLMGPGGSLSPAAPAPSEGIRLLTAYYEPPGPSLERMQQFLRAMVFDHRLLTKELIEERYLASIQADAVANPLLTVSRRPVMEPLWRDFDKVGQETLLVWGQDDRTIPIDHAWLMMRLMPRARLHVFNKAGHWVQWERPEEFNRLVLGFLAG